MDYSAGCTTAQPESAPSEAHGSLSYSLTSTGPGVDDRKPHGQRPSPEPSKFLLKAAQSHGPHNSIAIRGRKEPQQIKC